MNHEERKKTKSGNGCLAALAAIEFSPAFQSRESVWPGPGVA